MHAAVRDVARGRGGSSAGTSGSARCGATSATPARSCALVGDVRPEELYNLAGESSVGASFADPRATWESNAHIVVHLLDAIRLDSPETRFYQASSGEMFGCVAGRERRPRRDARRSTRRARTPPRRPPRTCSAAATASRTGSGSPAGSSSTTSRGAAGRQFLSRKVVDHVHALRAGARVRPARAREPEGAARLGLRARLRRRDGRDPAPGGRCAACPTRRRCYRDYVLGTGRLHARLGARRPGVRPRRLRPRVVARGRRPARVDGLVRRLGRAGGRRRPGVHPARPTRRRSPPNPAKIVAELGWQPRPGLDRLPRGHARRRTEARAAAQ